ncbi:hypothetical protein [Pseudobacter ginsenosidimutans]|nr:hypothetical protein [Pseudobacter ginsenosidimutans]QEC44682.1 hypothetical protein FSB84_24475 [Pseudobacter ginsenosidimutans]
MYAYKKLWQANRTELRKSADALFIYTEAIRNPKLRQLGFTDDILARVKGSRLDEGSFVTVMTDLDRFGKTMAAHPTIEFDNFGSLIGKLTDGNPQNTQAAHWIIQDLTENANDFAGKKWNIELSVKNSDDNYAFIDLASNGDPQKFIEYKWLTINTVSKEDFIREFLKRDLYNPDLRGLSLLEWRIKGNKLAKAKVQEYLKSAEGREALESLGYEKAKALFPDDIAKFNEDNFVSFIINKFNQDDVFSAVFK